MIFSELGYSNPSYPWMCWIVNACFFPTLRVFPVRLPGRIGVIMFLTKRLHNLWKLPGWPDPGWCMYVCGLLDEVVRIATVFAWFIRARGVFNNWRENTLKSLCNFFLHNSRGSAVRFSCSAAFALSKEKGRRNLAQSTTQPTENWKQIRPSPTQPGTTLWQRHIRVNNLPKVVTQLCSGGNWTHYLLIASPTPYRYATAPPWGAWW